MIIYIVKNNTLDLSKYKKTLKDLKITHQEVADYIGRTRETTTIWLNGKKPPVKIALHVSAEIEQLIEQHSNSHSKPDISKRYE